MRAELMSALDQLSSLRDELRGNSNGFEPELLAEAHELLSKACRAVDQLAPLYPALDTEAVKESGTRGFDPLTIISTVGITTIVLPFVQSLVESAGNDVYRTLVNIVRRRRASKESEAGSASRPDPQHILLGDRATNARVIIDASVDRAALLALLEVDLSADWLREATLRWNPEKKAWEPEPGRGPVKLWLPGDPLDEDWRKAP
ncbi:hypothetical protein [Nonomuraea polychroma]|uniref:hypothetical protein n=1 Tax=Nonomuraea polychroma TaxID=46176 RepID=UPI000FDD3253|nr:hypothetical protein [Nonomuraea polychroma]